MEKAFLGKPSLNTAVNLPSPLTLAFKSEPLPPDLAVSSGTKMEAQFGNSSGYAAGYTPTSYYRFLPAGDKVNSINSSFDQPGHLQPSKLTLEADVSCKMVKEKDEL